MTDAVALLGICWEEGATGPRGAAAGPQAVRERLFSDAGNGYAESGVAILDRLVDVGDPDLPLAEVAGRKAIEVAARDAAAVGAVLALGGDHSVTLPLMRAAATRHGPLHVLHFDAHPDLYPELDGRRYSHASPFVRGLEEGLIERLVQVGIRANSPPQREVVARYGDRVRQYGPADLAAIDGEFLGSPRYVTIDIDALDPAFAPGVAHPEAGGLTVRELVDVIRRLGRNWIAADLVEVVPERDVAGLTAVAAAKVIKELIAVH